MSDDRNTDPYYRNLIDQGRSLDDRDQAVDQKEAEIRAERETIASDRAQWKAAMEHYRRFRESIGRPLPGEPLGDSPTPRNESVVIEPLRNQQDVKPENILADNVVARAGDQRLAILEALAYLSSGGKFTTNKDIKRRTQLRAERVSNVIYKDVKRGFIERVNNRVRMTPTGYEFLKALGSPAGNMNDSNTVVPHPSGEGVSQLH